MNSINIKDIGGKYLTVENENARRQLEQYAETGTMVTESYTGKTYKRINKVYYAWWYEAHPGDADWAYTLTPTPAVGDIADMFSPHSESHVEVASVNEELHTFTDTNGQTWTYSAEQNIDESGWEEVGTGGSEDAIEVVNELPDNPPIGKTVYLIQDGQSAVLQYQEKYYYAYHNSDQNMTLYTTTQNFNWDMLLYYDNGNEIVQYNKDYGLDYLDSEGQYFDCGLYIDDEYMMLRFTYNSSEDVDATDWYDVTAGIKHYELNIERYYSEQIVLDFLSNLPDDNFTLSIWSSYNGGSVNFYCSKAMYHPPGDHDYRYWTFLSGNLICMYHEQWDGAIVYSEFPIGSDGPLTEKISENLFIWFTENSPYDMTYLDNEPSGDGEYLHIYYYTSGRASYFYTYKDGNWILLGNFVDEPGGPYYTVEDEFTLELFLEIMGENSIDSQAREVAAGAMALAAQTADKANDIETAIALYNSYSFDEKWTGGTWVDGKKIYKKTYDLGDVPVPSGSSVYCRIPFDVDFDTVVEIKGMIVPNASSTPTQVEYYSIPKPPKVGSSDYNVSLKIKLYNNVLNLELETKSDLTNKKAYATVYYTKNN